MTVETLKVVVLDRTVFIRADSDNPYDEGWMLNRAEAKQKCACDCAGPREREDKTDA